MPLAAGGRYAQAPCPTAAYFCTHTLTVPVFSAMRDLPSYLSRYRNTKRAVGRSYGPRCSGLNVKRRIELHLCVKITYWRG